METPQVVISENLEACFLLALLFCDRIGFIPLKDNNWEIIILKVI